MNAEETAVKKPLTIALAVPWCPWLPERCAAKARLFAALGLDSVRQSGAWVYDFREFTEQLPNDQWSEQVFTWLAAQDVEWCMQIQEDALVPENFWPAVYALLEALPAEADVVGLHVCHPMTGELAANDVRLFTTADALVGVCWIVRREVLVEFLRWRAEELRDGWRTPVPPKNLPGITEDTMLGLFAMATGRRIWHTVPALVDHDTTMASVHGNDEHVNRRPRVTWRDSDAYGRAWLPEDLEHPGFWRGEFKRLPEKDPEMQPTGRWIRAVSYEPEPPRHLGRFYEATPGLARKWVKGFGVAEELAARQDDGQRERKRLVYSQRARGDWESKARILVCTPTRGGIHPEYVGGMLATIALLEVDVDNGFELLDSWQWHEDLVRVRSRFLRAARETSCTHVHFRDADVKAHSSALLGMLQSGHDFVITPYPRREPHPVPYAVGWLPTAEAPKLDRFGCAPIGWGPLGCSLISRRCFETMIDYYAEVDARRVDLENAYRVGQAALREPLPVGGVITDLVDELQRWRAGEMGLSFVDRCQGQDFDTVALFQLLVAPSEDTGKARLWAEDQSFCRRARARGFGPQLYLGPGSPADHAGDVVHRGDIAAFGLHRVGESASGPER